MNDGIQDHHEVAYPILPGQPFPTENKPSFYGYPTGEELQKEPPPDDDIKIQWNDIFGWWEVVE